MKEIRILIVGTGGMSGHHAEHYNKIPGVRVVAGVDTNPERLAAFLTRFGADRGFASIDEALAWGAFDAVSNVTPDAAHKATTLPFLAAGKHVMCEKPLAANHADAVEMAEAAQKAGVVNMVNFTYRNGPALMKAAQMVAEGAIGEVRHFEASYLQSWLTQTAWGDWSKESQWLWRLSKAHGSLGVLGDVGVHILDFATLVAGATPSSLSARLTTFDKAPGGRIGDYVLDANDSFTMHTQLTNGAVGVVHASRMASGHLNDLFLRIFGTKGGLDVRWENNVSILRASVGEDMKTGVWRDLDPGTVPMNYERFIAAIRDGRMETPDFARGAAIQQVLDLAVESDEKGGCTLTV